MNFLKWFFEGNTWFRNYKEKENKLRKEESKNIEIIHKL